MTRSYIDWWRRIAALPLTTSEWAVLTTIAAHADWADGDQSFPSIETIADTTGLAERSVKRALHSLSCAVGPGQDCGDDRCNHRGVLVVQHPATRHRPTTYALRLDEQAVQPHLPEVGRGGMLSGEEIRARFRRRGDRRGDRGARQG